MFLIFVIYAPYNVMTYIHSILLYTIVCSTYCEFADKLSFVIINTLQSFPILH